MHYYKITITEKRTVEVFQQGESEDEVCRRALDDADHGNLDWAFQGGKKLYWANVELADDMFADESIRVEREIALAE